MATLFFWGKLIRVLKVPASQQTDLAFGREIETRRSRRCSQHARGLAGAQFGSAFPTPPAFSRAPFSFAPVTVWGSRRFGSPYRWIARCGSTRFHFGSGALSRLRSASTMSSKLTRQHRARREPHGGLRFNSTRVGRPGRQNRTFFFGGELGVPHHILWVVERRCRVGKSFSKSGLHISAHGGACPM